MSFALPQPLGESLFIIMYLLFIVLHQRATGAPGPLLSPGANGSARQQSPRCAASQLGPSCVFAEQTDWRQHHGDAGPARRYVDRKSVV